MKESPIHSGYFSQYNGYFNYTATYRIDSDFPEFYQEDGVYGKFIYNSFIWKKNEVFNENFNFSQGKFHLAAAMISYCDAHSRKPKKLKLHLVLEKNPKTGSYFFACFFSPRLKPPLIFFLTFTFVI
jgi:hypothetical protein